MIRKLIKYLVQLAQEPTTNELKPDVPTPDNNYESTLQLGSGQFEPSDAYNNATYIGWSFSRGRYKTGERVLITTKSGQDCRYLIEEAHLYSDPDDMFRLRLKFDPRVDAPSSLV
jgi:hypothetical protein